MDGSSEYLGKFTPPHLCGSKVIWRIDSRRRGLVEQRDADFEPGGKRTQLFQAFAAFEFTDSKRRDLQQHVPAVRIDAEMLPPPGRFEVRDISHVRNGRARE